MLIHSSRILKCAVFSVFREFWRINFESLTFNFIFQVVAQFIGIIVLIHFWSARLSDKIQIHFFSMLTPLFSNFTNMSQKPFIHHSSKLFGLYKSSFHRKKVIDGFRFHYKSKDIWQNWFRIDPQASLWINAENFTSKM